MSRKVGNRTSQRKRQQKATRLRKAWRRRQQRILKRLDKHPRPGDGLSGEDPVLAGGNVHAELAERERGTAHGGVAVIHRLVQELGLPQEIDRRLDLLRWYRPYHESDHVLNFAYNALCGGDCLQDMELRRHDEAFLDSLGARRTPDPTTAGDFCRRFNELHIRTLLGIFNDVRLKVWQRQPETFFAEACIDLDGTLVGTAAEKKAGIDVAYDGTWGYHPLVVSLAQTGEVLSIVNRPANRPSHEGAAEEADRAVELCRRAGFRRIVLRGDTDFTQTRHLDRWDEQQVTFVFGTDARANVVKLAEEVPAANWQRLERPAKYTVKTEARRRADEVKEPIVEARGYKNLKLLAEDVAEVEYRPSACRRTYRLVILRKHLQVDEGQTGQGRLFEEYRYFFYLTNDREATAAAIVYAANDRCNQENLHAELKSGVWSLTTPVNDLLSNWAYMVMTSQAWNFKAWLALWPSAAGPPKQQTEQREEQRRVLRMEFKTFVNGLMNVPAQVVRTGRRLVLRMLSWTPWQPLLFRVLATFRPLRC